MTTVCKLANNTREELFMSFDVKQEEIPAITLTETPDEMLRRLLRNNPEIASELLKQSGATFPTALVAKEPKVKTFSRPSASSDYILTTISICLLCRSVQIEQKRLTWDSLSGSYRASILAKEMPDALPIKLSRLEHASCDKCNLVLLSKDHVELAELCKTLSNPHKTTLRDLETKKLLSRISDQGDLL